MNHTSLLSTAAASSLQPGSGLRRIVCLAALLVVFATTSRAHGHTQTPLSPTATE